MVRGESAPVVVGVAVAVLSVTLLAGTGLGVLETGERQFESADRDLWVTAGETRVTPSRGGGFENTLTDSRSRAAEIESHEDVEHAIPIAFETVYVETGDGEYETIVATGVPGTGPAVQLTEGQQFSDPGRHYANGSYDGEMTHEVIVDRRVAEEMNASVGESVRIGGSLATAREHEFTVVGVSPTFSNMLGTQTVVLPLDEFHRVTGSTETEPATFIVVTLHDDADLGTVARDLRASHPEISVRTNEQQLEAVLGEQVLVLVAGVALVALAFVTGLLLTAHVLALLVHQQHATFAALAAQGCSRLTIGAVVAWQGLAIGCLGALVGVAATPPAVAALNAATAAVVGYEGLVVVAPRLLAAGGGLAVAVGTLGAVVAGGRVVRGRPLERLQ